jgi:hypothetical protein
VLGTHEDVYKAVRTLDIDEPDEKVAIWRLTNANKKLTPQYPTSMKALFTDFAIELKCPVKPHMTGHFIPYYSSLATCSISAAESASRCTDEAICSIATACRSLKLETMSISPMMLLIEL